MAKYYGYVSVPHATYDEWRNATNGNGYDADGQYGCQCYDLALIFWYNVGFPQGYPVSSSLGANGIWDRRSENISFGGTEYFELVTTISDIKRGDVICYDGFVGNPYGHIGFADEDYATWHANNPGSYEFPILSENNGGTPDPQGGAYTNVHGYDIRLFQGAFRYKQWIGPTPPPTSDSEHHFPWFLTANKRRGYL